MIITADDRIGNIDCHFKVSAGPGAGKTRWLVNHMRHVLENSHRLGSCRKIACITYTNVAAETILERLGTQVDRVEVSTIHGYLYRNVIKPFSFLIPGEYGLSIAELDGHDEIPINNGWIYEWKTRTRQSGYLKDDAQIAKALRSLSWQLEGTKLELRLRAPFLGKIGSYWIKKGSMIEYKKLYWQKGVIDHDDVLFFSYLLIQNHPRILNVLAVRFPYFFVDEFQDTNPIQTAILKQIGKSGTAVGVIGDIAQSIYGFQGANPDQFTNFQLPGIQSFEVLDNFRSTARIVSVLNRVRPDIVQKARREVEGSSPLVMVGDKLWALTKAEEITGRQVCSLARNNITSNLMREKKQIELRSRNISEEIIAIDSNPNRAHVVIACVRAVEYARQGRYGESKKEIQKQVKRVCPPDRSAIISLTILKLLLKDYDSYRKKNLLNFTVFLNERTELKVSTFKAGKIKNFYVETTYDMLASAIDIKDDTSLHRTIHKAKGAEFDDVLLILDSQGSSGTFRETEELAFLLNPDLGDEEQRVRYVGISRARDSLMINVPDLSSDNAKALSLLGFNVIRQDD